VARRADDVQADDDDTRRDWVSFEHDGDTWMFDATFLMSPYRCIYGEGCPGIEPGTEDLHHGCCSHGAHFADRDDRTRVRRFAKSLTKDQWQLRSVAREMGGPIGRNEDGDWVTRTHDGACVFLNRVDFHRGPGCALHVAALDAGERPLDWKPEVCWQVPLRLSFHDDEVDHTTHTLREWKRRDWGEGGLDFHWWCVEEPEAFVDARPVVVSMREEIVEMVGEAVYQRLLDHLGLGIPGETWLPHPAVRRNSAAPA
jgi:hypothetical protein